MKFDYEDLSDAQFETFVVFLCQRLLGISVQGFAKGPDGGRDAKFVGTAELHPSRAAPWVGTTIIQAKHTNGYNRNFSESDFFSTTAQNTVLGKEIPRVKQLRESKQHREGVALAVADEVQRLADGGEHAERQQIDLQQSDRVDVVLDLPVPAAHTGDHAVEPTSGDGNQLR